MGYNLVSALANIFTSFCKPKWLNEYNLNKAKFCLKYVDDILAAFEKEEDSLNLSNFLNNKNSSIKFTIGKLFHYLS